MSYAMMAAGVLCSAAAQILMKRAAHFPVLSGPWIGWMGGSAASYAISFLLYAAILRRLALSVVAPTMTVSVMCVAVAGGLLMGETLTVRQWLGLALGVGSVVAVLG